MLKVKRLHPNATLPTVAHPGEDAGYDLYASERVVLRPFVPTKVPTGIAAQSFSHGQVDRNALLIRDRSSIASKGLIVTAGVVDHGYTGEIQVLITNTNPDREIQLNLGDKIAQMIPMPILTGRILEVAELGETSRGDKGFGSSGQ